ncbi:MAG: putative lipid II flippase FtsW [Calditrichaeota bacterium]|nr:MAG: putative lipid II flippase FtsW [Calditrichota bacterium]
MKTTQSVDRLIGIITILLIVLGPLMVFSSSTVYAGALKKPQAYFFEAQLKWDLIAVVFLLVFSRLPLNWLKKQWVILGVNGASIVLLAGLFIFGKTINGATRWYHLGFVNFQPSELTKLALILFFADRLTRPGLEKGDYKQTALPMFAWLGLSMLLILKQPDLGTALVIGMIGVAMMFVSRLRLRYIVLSILPAFPLLALYLGRGGYQAERIKSWFLGLHDPMHGPDQVMQSIVGLANGGVTGVGFGESRQKLLFLPEAHTDFIFSIISEEFGLIGGTLILLAFLTLVIRGLRVARRAPDAFSSFVAYGISIYVGLYAFMNVAVVTGVMPTTGLPLPFISYGGSHLIFMSIAMGVLLSISRETTPVENHASDTKRFGKAQSRFTQSLVR